MGKAFVLFGFHEFREIVFGLDISLQAPPRRNQIDVRKWHQEMPNDVIKSDMEVEEI